MTPGARLAAAMEVLDAALAGAPLERALTGWARASRFAGAKDRAAVRDLVYQGWRCRRSHAALGGAGTGRGIVLGGLRAAGTVPETLMTGAGHAPAPPGPQEGGRTPEGAEALDLPDWLWPLFRTDLGTDAADVAEALRHRAPVFLRVNLARTTRDQAIEGLATDEIVARPHDHVRTALEVTENPRRIAQSTAYADGVVELQDASSQAAVLALPLTPGARLLDYCAGGGGKALAVAALAPPGAPFDLWAHDAIPARLADLAPRAARAGVRIHIVDGDALAGLPPFDVVLVDAPCSGSGTWRRDPDGKWRLTDGRLDALVALQSDILDAACLHVAPGGVLAYATCSVLGIETTGQVSAFLHRHPGWTLESRQAWRPGPAGDGFSLAVLRRAP